MLRSGEDFGQADALGFAGQELLGVVVQDRLRAALGFGLREDRLAHLQHRRLRERRAQYLAAALARRLDA